MSGTAMATTGSCLCGAVRFRIDGPLRDVIVCHCSVCRRSHGSVGMYAGAPRDAVAVEDVQGARRSYEHEGATYTFCGACGSQLFWSRPHLAHLAIAAGALHEPTGVTTTHHIYCGSRGDWEVIADGLPTFEESTPEAPTR